MNHFSRLCLLILLCHESLGFLSTSLPSRNNKQSYCPLSDPKFSQPRIVSFSASTTEDEARKRLLDQAAKLRQEAEALEVQLRATRRPRSASTMSPISTSPEPSVSGIEYSRIPGSIWKLTYRFASEPAKDEQQNEKPVTFYRGKLTLHFKPDGYTELVSHDDDGTDHRLEIAKIWGWDEELSLEDGKNYVSFSMDATTSAHPSKQRFYFQARLEKEKGDEISLKEGTVTVKQDLAQSKGIMKMGFFSAQGILAQFRYVGDFIAKPAAFE